MAKEKATTTPLMKQYNELKAQHPDTILLFRVGDFYETFGSDAIETSKILNITLTKRGGGDDNPLAGFPHHAIDTYLPKFLREGKKVAICEQLEDPKSVKGLVKRGIVEIATPSLSYSEQTMQGDRNNFLASIHYTNSNIGVAFLDLSTGEFLVSEGSLQDVDKIIRSFAPKEIIVQKKYLRDLEASNFNVKSIKTYEDWVFTKDFAHEILNNQFSTLSLKGFGVEKMENSIIAAGAIMNYLKETMHNELNHICSIKKIDNNNFMWLDGFTIKNLELIYAHNGTSLFDILNHCSTHMGSRLLQRWIVLPLIDKQEIDWRLNIVESFLMDSAMQENTLDSLNCIGDLERLVSKIAMMRVQPNELYALTNILREIFSIKNNFSISNSPYLQELSQDIVVCKELNDLLIKYISPSAPNNISKGGAIAFGVDEELDYYRRIGTDAKELINDILKREIETTGISSLKISYNNVFGYYLEVTNTHKDKVPESWIRKQTLTNAERYITEELKDLETKILNASEIVSKKEYAIYYELLERLKQWVEPLQKNAQILAQIDCLLSFAIVAKHNKYTKPTITEDFTINITEGRHPVIEKTLPIGTQYISNDVYLDKESSQIAIITGPNMSGKSAYLRQTALIVLMAQIGCYVPALSAQIGIIDKIFTRVGASDNLSAGESTFMVEMNETACILNNLSSRSLVLLDEIGRGTSTYDGVSIAWAIGKYLHDSKLCPKTLFATHYHELTVLEDKFPRVKNLHVKVREQGKKVIFLRKIAEGCSQKSFGIHVARLAGMPKEVLKTSEEMLEILENNSQTTQSIQETIKSQEKEKSMQLSFIQLEDPLLLQLKDDILSTDIDNLTPVECLVKLHDIKKMLEKI
jgi:DNA mismatch repair protein MutS